jgi:hypothetical protein
MSRSVSLHSPRCRPWTQGSYRPHRKYSALVLRYSCAAFCHSSGESDSTASAIQASAMLQQRVGSSTAREQEAGTWGSCSGCAVCVCVFVPAAAHLECQLP